MSSIDAIGGATSIVALLALGAPGCAHYDLKIGPARVAAAPELIAEQVPPEKQGVELAGCIAADSLWLGTDWARQQTVTMSNRHSRLETVRLGYQAASCYEVYARGVAGNAAVSLDERIVITLAAERSVLAVDPDPVDRLQRAARLADLAAKQFADRGDDDERIDASLRAAWYAARSKAPALRRVSQALWSDVEQSDATLQQELDAQLAQMRQTVSMIGGLGGVGVGMQTLSGVSKVSQTVAKVSAMAKTAERVVQVGSQIAKLTTKLADGRADLGMLLEGGTGVLGDLMPQLSRRIAALRSAVGEGQDVVATVDAVANGDVGAGSRLLVRMAHAFGAQPPQRLLDAAGAAATVSGSGK